jgi:formylglycine-generating enzyme required for sulfatase activity
LKLCVYLATIGPLVSCAGSSRNVHPKGMAMIPSGCYQMKIHLRQSLEPIKESRKVCLDSFEIDVTEVTIGEYEKCVISGKCAKPTFFPRLALTGDSITNSEYDFSRRTYIAGISIAEYREKGFSIENKRYPVVAVTWQDAYTYCREIGKRLPSDAEWEYSMIGGEDSLLHFQKEFDPSIGWFRENSKDKAHPVALKPANGYGLFDMLGNVSEYVNDFHQLDFYQTDLEMNPLGPDRGEIREKSDIGEHEKSSATRKSGDRSLEMHVVRGGSWETEYTRTSPFWRWKDEYRRTWSTGFRCAR